MRFGVDKPEKDHGTFGVPFFRRGLFAPPAEDRTYLDALLAGRADSRLTAAPLRHTPVETLQTSQPPMI